MTCKIANCEGKVFCKQMCCKHYKQMYKHGKIFSITNHDFNEVIDKKDHYEIILTDTSMKEVGRAKIDKDDLDKVRSIGRWSLMSKGYVINGHTKILMHRFILNAKPLEEVDHKKTGFKAKSDNRKKNLRKCLHHENHANKELTSSNTSGYKGIYKKRNRWIASVKHKDKKYYLGSFLTKQEAHKAYCKKSKELNKEFHNPGT